MNREVGFLRSKKGFSLIEVIVAIMILAIGIMALIGAYSVYIRSDTYAKIKTIELNIARSKIEEALASPSPNYEQGEEVSNNFKFEYEVVVITRKIVSDISVYEIRVRVRKANNAREKGVELIAYKEKP